MIKAIIVEDDISDAKLLEGYLKQMENDVGGITVKRYDNGPKFLADYKSDADIVFMDVCLPDYDGFDVCHKLRERDPNVVIMFVTNMAQYAIRGYEVNAVDYLLKPVQYYSFLMKMRKVLKIINDRVTENYIIVHSNGTKKRLNIKEIAFVEVNAHLIKYYTNNEFVETTGSLKAVECELSPHSFVRCNSCYLVNLGHVIQIDNDFVTVDNKKLPFSRGKKKEFINRLTEYYGECGRK